MIVWIEVKAFWFFLPALDDVFIRCESVRACLKIPRGAAARSIGRGPGGEVRAGAPPEGAQRAMPTEPTPATTKRPAAQRVFPPLINRLGCSVVEGSPEISALVSSSTPVSLGHKNRAPHNFQTRSEGFSPSPRCGAMGIGPG
jgi:hypothetical protein